MKTAKIAYYVTTLIVALMMIYSVVSYLTNATMIKTFQHLGFPDYFRVELAVAKLVGAIILLAPVSIRLKDLAYAGFALAFISAIIAHTCSGDPMPYPVVPLIFLVLLAGSYFSYSKWQNLKTLDIHPSNS